MKHLGHDEKVILLAGLIGELCVWFMYFYLGRKNRRDYNDYRD